MRFTLNAAKDRCSKLGRNSFLLLVLLATISGNSFGQTDCDCYDRLVNLSAYYEAKGKLGKALKALESGMSHKKKAKWTAYECSQLGKLAALNGNSQQACQYLEEALARGWDRQSLEGEEFAALRQSNHWKALLERLDSLQGEFQKNIHWTYRLALEDIRGSDQTIRRLIEVDPATFRQLDSINYTRLKALMDQYGYPDMEQHGFDGSQGAYLILLHASMYSEEMYADIQGILTQAIKNFGYKKSNLAQFIDRREVWHHGRVQLYGTWNAYRAKEFKEFRNPSEIDKLRLPYNLLRIKEQAVMENRDLPANYNPTPYPEGYFCGHDFRE